MLGVAEKEEEGEGWGGGGRVPGNVEGLHRNGRGWAGHRAGVMLSGLEGRSSLKAGWRVAVMLHRLPSIDQTLRPYRTMG
jgi:hypothetical protein